MRIVIEIDGASVVATHVSRDPASAAPGSSEPPEYLREAARALGAESAGPARFTGGAEFPPADTREASVPSAAYENTGDADAGSAAAADLPAAAAPRPLKRVKRGGRPRRG
jgi:hypothetical protein